MASIRSASGFALALLAAWGPGDTARAISSYTADVTQPFASIAHDAGATGATAGAVSPIGAWSASAEIDPERALARATTVGCEFAAGFQQVCNTIASRADGTDLIRLLPTQNVPAGAPVAIVFYWFLDGSVDGLGAWGAGGSLTLVGLQPFFPLGQVSAGYTTGGVAVQANQASYSEAKTFVVTLNVGQTYTLSTSINTSSAVRTCPFGSNSCNLPLGIDVDFTDGGRIAARPLGSGFDALQLVGDSGRDYLAPVPEPGAPALPVLGAIALAGISARRGRSPLASRDRIRTTIA